MTRVLDRIAVVSLIVFAVITLIAHTIVMTPSHGGRVPIYILLGVLGSMSALSARPRVRLLAPALVTLSMALMVLCMFNQERARLEGKAWEQRINKEYFDKAVAAAREEGMYAGMAEARKAASQSRADDVHNP